MGTGLSLPLYDRHLEVYGVDLSPHMLRKARERVDREGLDHVKELREMDALALEYPDDSFDTVVSMYTITAAPEPAKMMQELARVTKPGGEIVILSHFQSPSPGWRKAEEAFRPIARWLGWRPELPVETISQVPGVELEDESRHGIFKLFSLLRFRKPESFANAA